MTDFSDTTAIILAGGLGTRLRAVVHDRPKVLAEIRGRPFLAYLLKSLVVAGVRHAVLCTGYLGEQLKSTFAHAYQGMRLVYSHELSPLGTGGAVRAAISHVASDPVLVMNGDSYCETDFSALWNWHNSRAAEATLVATHVPDTARYGRVFLDDQGVVTAFQEKGRNSGPGWINAGVYLIGRRLLSTIPADRAISLERDIFPTWIGQGLYGYAGQGRFLDIGTPETYAAAEEFFSPFDGADGSASK